MKKWIRNRRADLIGKSPSAEQSAYDIIKGMGLRVIRQHPIETGRHVYFADLFVPSLHLVVEIDGGYHTTGTQRRLDRNRSANIRRIGYHVCRLSNRDARSRAKVREKIQAMANRISRV